MPRAGPLKQLLRALSVAELRAIRREFCPQVTQYNGDKDAFINRVRNSLKRSIDKGDVSYQEVMEVVRTEISEQGPKTISGRIKQILDEIEISSNAGHENKSSVREEWICSEIFQGLRYQLQTKPVAIEQEASFGTNRVDLLISHTKKKQNFIIELKLAGNYAGRKRLLTQLRRYRKNVPYLQWAFVVLIVEKRRDLPTNKKSINHVVEELSNEPKTKVVIKPPDDLRY